MSGEARFRRRVYQGSRHLLALLGAMLAGNALFALTGGMLFGQASASTMVRLPVTASRVGFQLDPADPTKAVAVTFSAIAADGTVPASVDVVVGAAGTSRHACDRLPDSDRWTCDLPGLSIARLHEIRVRAD